MIEVYSQQNALDAARSKAALDQAGKKLIYDRIVGGEEVLGSQ